MIVLNPIVPGLPSRNCLRISTPSPEVSRKRIERDEKDREQDNKGISSTARLFRLFKEVGDCGTEKKYLQCSHETRDNFHQGKLTNKREKENRAACHRRSQTQGDRKNVAELVHFLHFFACA